MLIHSYDSNGEKSTKTSTKVSTNQKISLSLIFKSKGEKEENSGNFC